MRKIVFFSIIVALLLAGCAREAYYTDREFGLNSSASFDRMIINTENEHAGKVPDGLAGIHAEPAMESYQKTFSDNFKRENINISDFEID